MNAETALSYDDLWIIPRKQSELRHRSEADTSVECFGIKLSVPMIASPMPDVTNGKMARELSKIGALGIIHRFQSIEEQVKQYSDSHCDAELQNNNTRLVFDFAVKRRNFGCAIGIGNDYQDRFKELYKAGCRIFCLDTANGFNSQVKEAIEWIRDIEQIKQRATQTMILEGSNRQLPEKVYVIAGNVATKEGYRFLANLGVDAIRVGIAGGSQCITRTETGVYFPMVSSILECIEERLKLWSERVCDTKNIPVNELGTIKTKLPLIIADGGIRAPSDMCKALALGADLVMCGSMFAGTKEAPGAVRKYNGRLFKQYNGAASFATQKDYKKEEPEYNEGDESLVEYKGSVEKVVKRFKAGLQSSMSYLNAKNLNEYHNNANFTKVT